MKKDIVNETFQKHLKLLHKHLNINEGYGDPAYNDWAMRDQGVRPDWDPDGLTGIRQPSSWDSPTITPEQEAEARKRAVFPKTVAGYAQNNRFDAYHLKIYLNQIKCQGKNNWKTTDIFEPHRSPRHYPEFDQNMFKMWAERDKEESDRNYEKRQKKEKEEAPSREINSKVSVIRSDMTQLIHNIGIIKWQVFKLQNPEQKLKYLSDYFKKNKDKLKKVQYERLKPYFDLYSKNDKNAKLILLAAIKACEKDASARGFFEQ